MIRGFQNVKYIAVTSRASKLQVFKVRPGRDLNPGHPRQSLNIGKLTHAGGPGSNPRVPQLWRLVTLKPLKLQQCTLHFWKPLIFFYLYKRGQEHSCMFSLWYAIGKTHRFTLWNRRKIYRFLDHYKLITNAWYLKKNLEYLKNHSRFVQIIYFQIKISGNTY